MKRSASSLGHILSTDYIIKLQHSHRRRQASQGLSSLTKGGDPAPCPAAGTGLPRCSPAHRAGSLARQAPLMHLAFHAVPSTVALLFSCSTAAHQVRGPVPILTKPACLRCIRPSSKIANSTDFIELYTSAALPRPTWAGACIGMLRIAPPTAGSPRDRDGQSCNSSSRMPFVDIREAPGRCK